MSQREFCLATPGLKDDPLFKVVSMIFEVAPGVLTEHGKTKNPWPNVDAQSGVIQWYFGLKEWDFYTVPVRRRARARLHGQHHLGPRPRLTRLSARSRSPRPCWRSGLLKAAASWRRSRSNTATPIRAKGDARPAGHPPSFVRGVPRRRRACRLFRRHRGDGRHVHDLGHRHAVLQHVHRLAHAEQDRPEASALPRRCTSL